MDKYDKLINHLSVVNTVILNDSNGSDDNVISIGTKPGALPFRTIMSVAIVRHCCPNSRILLIQSCDDEHIRKCDIMLVHSMVCSPRPGCRTVFRSSPGNERYGTLGLFWGYYGQMLYDQPIIDAVDNSFIKQYDKEQLYKEKSESDTTVSLSSAIFSISKTYRQVDYSALTLESMVDFCVTVLKANVVHAKAFINDDIFVKAVYEKAVCEQLPYVILPYQIHNHAIYRNRINPNMITSIINIPTMDGSGDDFTAVQSLGVMMQCDKLNYPEILTRKCPDEIAVCAGLTERIIYVDGSYRFRNTGVYIDDAIRLAKYIHQFHV